MGCCLIILSVDILKSEKISGWHYPPMIVFCASATEETLEHLFRMSICYQACWNVRNVLHLTIQPGDPFQTLSSLRAQLNAPFFMDVIIMMSWCIWMEWNDLIFKGIQLNINKMSHPDSRMSLL
jgi:hypothetical protein